MKGLLTSFTLYFLLFTQQMFSQHEIFISKTDSLLNYLHQKNRFCGTILVSKGDDLIYHKTFSATTDLPSNENYRIASITKMFTAVIIYQLAEENKLSLPDKLNKYYPEIENAESITIQQMLGHQSGIKDIISNDDFSSIKSNSMTKMEVLKMISSYKPVFEPGEKTQYSNSNYILLGYIIEDISGIPFSDVLTKRICEPLGLNETYVEGSGGNITRNTGYLFNGAGWEASNSETNATISAAAGAIISSPADLNRFIQALFNDDLVNNNSLDTMCSLTNSTYGHGIFYTPYLNHAGFGHTGHIDEFRSFATYLNADSVSLVFCFNGLNYAMNEIAIGVLSYYFDDEYKFPDLTTITLTEDELQKYQGIYRLKLFHFIPILKVKIMHENGVLSTAQLKNFEEEKSIVEPIAADTFKNFQYSSTLYFVYKKNGKIKGCYLEQGKNKLYCRKLKSEV